MVIGTVLIGGTLGTIYAGSLREGGRGSFSSAPGRVPTEASDPHTLPRQGVTPGFAPVDWHSLRAHVRQSGTAGAVAGLASILEQGAGVKVKGGDLQADYIDFQFAAPVRHVDFSGLGCGYTLSRNGKTIRLYAG